MKKLKMLFVAIMVLVTGLIGTVVMTGCDKGNYLKVATEAAFAPFEYNENGKIVGFDIDLIDAIAKKLGYDGAKVESMDFTTVIPSVQRGAYDVAIAGLTVSAERAEKVDFSNSYFNASQTIVYKGAVQTFADEDAIWEFLKGKKIGVVTGFSGDLMITDAVKKNPTDDEDYPYDGKLKGFVDENNIIRYKTAGIAATALKNGSDIDVLVVDYDPAKSIAKKIEGLNASDIKIGDEKYAIAVKKGNTELLNKINAALEELIADGTFEQLKAKYFE